MPCNEMEVYIEGTYFNVGRRNVHMHIKDMLPFFPWVLLEFLYVIFAYFLNW